MTAHRKRTCNGCGIEKALDAFYRHPSGKDGRESKCKLCRRAQVYANRELKADYYRAKSREREARPERIAYKRNYHRHYVRTARGRESRRITQRAYRAFRKAAGLPPFPSDRPNAVAARNRRFTERRHESNLAQARSSKPLSIVTRGEAWQ